MAKKWSVSRISNFPSPHPLRNHDSSWGAVLWDLCGSPFAHLYWRQSANLNFQSYQTTTHSPFAKHVNPSSANSVKLFAFHRWFPAYTNTVPYSDEEHQFWESWSKEVFYVITQAYRKKLLCVLLSCYVKTNACLPACEPLAERSTKDMQARVCGAHNIVITVKFLEESQ